MALKYHQSGSKMPNGMKYLKNEMKCSIPKLNKIYQNGISGIPSGNPDRD
jgi:hypothetical protein